MRDFLKWDDQPASLQQFAESAVRAYKIAMTPPMGPVLLSLDGELQENPIPEDAKLRIPRLPRTAPPQGDANAVDEAAKLLVMAEAPVLIADRLARTPAGVARLVELAETLQAPVVDTFGRMNFPSRHPLNHTHRARSVVSQADVIVGLETLDFWGQTHSYRDQIHRASRPITKPTVKTVSIGVGDLYLKANYQNFQRFADVDLAIAADGEATLPSLIEAVKRQIDGDRKTAFEARGKKLAAAYRAMLEEARNDAAVGWDASPITTARLAAELWEQVRNDDWSLLSANLQLPEPVAAAPVEFRQASPLHRRLGRRRHRLRRAGRARRRARQSPARPAQRHDPGRRRPDVRARHPMDRGASQDPAALCRAQ